MWDVIKLKMSNQEQKHVFCSINREIPNLSKKLNANNNPQKKKQKPQSK